MESTQLQLLVDKRTKRWFQILATLERSSISSTKELTQLLNIPTRTLISDIKEIKIHFDQLILIIPSKKGYNFKVLDKVRYINKKKELLEHEPLLVILSGIFYGKNLSILEWADELFLTDRTLITHLKILDPILTHYKLKLTYPNLSLAGKEIDIRNFFLAIFYEEDTLPHYVFPSSVINDIISDMAHTEFDHFHLNVPFFRLSYLLFISYQRFCNGNRLTLNPEIIQIFRNSYLNSTLEQLCSSFKKNASVTLESSDFAYIFLMILDSDAYDDVVNLNPISQNDLSSNFLPMILDFCEELNIFPDEQTIAFIQSFFQLNYLKNAASPSCLFLPVALRQYYKLNYEDELKSINRFLKKHKKEFPVNSSAHFEYTLLLFSMRVLYKLEQKSYRIGFFFEGSIESTVLLEDLTRAYIPSNHKVYFFHTHILWEELDKLSIDLVVTNFSEYISQIPEGIDYILFNYNATAEDWNKLIKYIDPRLYKNYTISFNYKN